MTLDELQEEGQILAEDILLAALRGDQDEVDRLKPKLKAVNLEILLAGGGR